MIGVWVVVMLASVRGHLHQLCPTEVECGALVPGSVCGEAGLCECRSGWFPSHDNATCERVTHDNATCTTDDHCEHIPNSFCLNDTCNCLDGYITSFTNGTNRLACVHQSFLLPCDGDDDDCKNNLTRSCLNGKCVCDEISIFDNTISSCRPRRIGDPCINETDCAGAVTHSTCRDNKCECTNNLTAVNNGTLCKAVVLLGGTCSDDLECQVINSNAECVNSTCVCQQDFVPVNNNTACGHNVIHTQCSSTLDCKQILNNSMCQNEQCTCNPGYTLNDHHDACVPRHINDSCDTDIDCFVRDSICRSSICHCSLGYLPTVNLTKCIPRALGDECDVMEDCNTTLSNTVCDAGTRNCQCDLGFKPDDEGVCVLKTLKDTCEMTNDCRAAVANSECNAGKCECELGFHGDQEKGECTRRRVFDRTCSSVADCAKAVPNSYCLNRQCVCNSGYYVTDDNQTCTRFSIGGGKCKSMLDCLMAIDRSSCVKGQCVCTDGYMPIQNGTVCQKRVIGDPCNVDRDCYPAVFRSFCNESQCTCTEQHEPVPGMGACVYKPIRLLQECSFQEQCTRLDNRSVCSDNLFLAAKVGTSCICSGDFLVRTDTWSCYAPREIGDYCEDLTWCNFASNAGCSDNACACRPGYIPNATNNDCVKVPSVVGDYCRLDMDCAALAHTHCDEDSTCQCIYKYKPDSRGRTCVKRSNVRLPTVPEIIIGDQCRGDKGCTQKEGGRAYVRCGNQEGRQHDRCMCVPGYSSRHDATTFRCQEVQTYYFNINITQELGCDDVKKTGDDKLCYIYQPIRVLKQYNNQNTKYFLYIRDRITLNGIASLMNTTTPAIRDRYVNSDVINITEVDDVMQVGLLVHLSADYYTIISPELLLQEIVDSINRSDGEIGKSQLKVSQPIDTGIEFRDFDECTEQGGIHSDCASIAWCLNTRVSYMCSCKHGYDDWSLDPFTRPGRACAVPPEVTTDSLSCSNGTCENQWEYISLALIGYILLLFIFIGYEIYARKQKLQKSDIYYKIQKAARKAKMKALRERRKTIKKRKKEEKANRKWGDLTGSDEEEVEEPCDSDGEEQIVDEGQLI